MLSCMRTATSATEAGLVRSIRSGLGTRLAARPFSDGDLAEVTRLLAPPLGRLYPRGERWLTARLQDVVSGQASAFVAGTAGTVSGAVILTPKGARRVKLSTVYVDPDARRHGVGASLMAAALRHAHQGGAEEMWVTVAHDVVHELAPLLRRAGFAQTALELDRYGPGRHEAVFTRVS
jgi:ribosomal protein S18 acetylase RimI-like enzyme